MSKKAFNKGQPVTYIASWDDKGTFYFTQAIVHSCGVKQMVLTSEETGREMGRHFAPVNASIAPSRDTSGGGQRVAGTFPRMTDAEAEALCLELATIFIEEEAEGFRQRKIRNANEPGYCAAMDRNLAALHEPRAIKVP